jgi:site-specific DNA-cytosine methylase
MTYKLIDLFCGAGGMTLGFADARFCGGFEPVLAVDLDRSALETHKANFGGKTVHQPIEEWLVGDAEIPAADIARASACSTRTGAAMRGAPSGSRISISSAYPARACS